MREAVTAKQDTLAALTWMIPVGIWIGLDLLARTGIFDYTPRAIVMTLGAIRIAALPLGFKFAVKLLRKSELSKRGRIHARTGAFVCGTAVLLFVALLLYLFYLPKGEYPFWVPDP